jgi:rhombotail lipoprotein
LDATQKEQILASIKEHFLTRPYVRDIQIISEGYLNPHGGFDSLQQLARLQRLDVVALVSYDQVARQSENNRSFAYLTIVGAFLIRGSENETSTLLDLAVLDPTSRSLILRAAGTSHASGSSTAIRQSATVQQLSAQGLNAAAQELNANLDRELTSFAERVKAGNAPVRVVQSGGGSGAFDVTALMILTGAALLAIASRQRRPGGGSHSTGVEWQRPALRTEAPSRAFLRPNLPGLADHRPPWVGPAGNPAGCRNLPQ